ncbi:MAG: SDR family NAD(P)-dependent oxidoreductase [Promicromonosporaceae bacterium]|nr:SDR family NAD(P)-dependent oxidoreductase [Promicromonosporaceae bacterium]
MGTALITGATAGLGLEFAWQLAIAKHNVILVARNEERLQEVARQLRGATGVEVEVLVANLAKSADVQKVARRLRSAGTAEQPRVGLLVNNAGFGIAERFVDGNLNREIEALNVMVRAVLVLSRAAVGQMVTAGRGAIINIGSIAALTASGTYSAHKAWVRTFTEGLAAELQGTGVTATVVAPGLTRTEFHVRAELSTRELPEFGWLTPQRVVSEALADARRGVVLSTPSKRYKAAAALLRVAPRRMVRNLLARTGLRAR